MLNNMTEMLLNLKRELANINYSQIDTSLETKFFS